MNWLEMIQAYHPVNEQEKKDLALIMELSEHFTDLLSRSNLLAHVTSSSMIFNQSRDKVLMVHHNIYDTWSWTGGHADGEDDLLKVAMKEAGEETGITKVRPISEGIVSLDVLAVQGHVRKEQYVPSHLHLSVAFLLEGDEGESLKIKADENSGVRWIPVSELETCSREAHMITIYKKILSRLSNPE